MVVYIGYIDNIGWFEEMFLNFFDGVFNILLWIFDCDFNCVCGIVKI